MVKLHDFDNLQVGDVINNAVFLGCPEDGSEDWHALRSGKFGGSDIGTIYGVGFRSPYVEYYERYGNMSRQPIGEKYAEFGHALEPVTSAAFGRRFPQYIILDNPGAFGHVDNPLRITNPDALLFDSATEELVGIVDYKASEFGSGWGDAVERDGLVFNSLTPEKYRLQLQSYADAFEVNELWLAVLISGFNFRVSKVERDDQKADRDERVIQFDENGRKGIAPPYDGSFGALDFIRSQHPEIDKKEVYYLSQRQRDDLIFALSEKARVEGLENRIKAELLDKAGKQKAAKLQVGDKVVAIRTARGNGAPFLSLKEKVSDNPIEAVKK